jgi:hypothetical protein
MAPAFLQTFDYDLVVNDVNVLDAMVYTSSVQIGLNYLRESVGANIRDEFTH